MQSLSGRIYEIQKQIGNGTYGTVFSVIRDDGEIFAFKLFEKTSSDMDLGALREISILSLLKNSPPEIGILKLLDIIILDNDEQTVGIIMHKFNFDLYDAFQQKSIDKSKRLSIAYKLLEAVVFLHDNMIIHRDIKPENILLDDSHNPILADFTLSKVFNRICKTGTHTGKIATVTYRAPEVVANKPYGFPADVWSLGVVFYELFSGKQLSAQKDNEALDFLARKVKKIKNDPIGQMVKGLLHPDPNKRWTAKEALHSEVFGDFCINSNIPCIWNGIRKCKVSKLIKDMCKNFDAQKTITEWAAQTYLDRTECSPHSAVELACKFYETDLFDIETEDYPEDEMLILKKMEYNLFV